MVLNEFWLDGGKGERVKKAVVDEATGRARVQMAGSWRGSSSEPDEASVMIEGAIVMRGIVTRVDWGWEE